MTFPTPFQPPFQPGSKVYPNPPTNPIPTPVCSTPPYPLAVEPALCGAGTARRDRRKDRPMTDTSTTEHLRAHLAARLMETANGLRRGDVLPEAENE